jgi:hypothetical protein
MREWDQERETQSLQGRRLCSWLPGGVKKFLFFHRLGMDGVLPETANLIRGHRKLHSATNVCEIGTTEILLEQAFRMKKKSPHPSFDQTLELLRAHSFDVAPYAGVEGGVLVSKDGAGAVLSPASSAEDASIDDSKDPSVAYAVSPGIIVKGEVARLVDRGYQKFMKTSQYELPATATQLQAIHAFSEELKQLVGATSLYNESLGTTSDVYRYDRLMGREVADAAPAEPWELTDGH